MKKILGATIVAATFLTSFSAYAEGAYVSIDGGQANYSGDLAQGWDPNNSFSYQIAGGYNFTPMWGVEVGYAGLGKLNRPLTVSGVSVGAELNTKSYYLAATGTFPMNDKFSLFGKLGVANNKTDISGNALGVNVGVGTTNTTGLLAAVGGAYKLADNFTGTLAYTYFGNNDFDIAGAKLEGTVAAWTVGLKYKF